MKISVIIPTYKPQDYLCNCLESLAAQTFPKEDFEIVLVLNGCMEPYKSQIDQFILEKMQGVNINFIYIEECGVSNARNIGINNSIGEYLTFVDDDDVISNNYLYELSLVSTPTCVGCANSYAFIDDISERIPNFITKAFINCKDKIFNLSKSFPLSIL